MKKIIKAVIPAAGMGTRFLPATKALPKEMLPIVNIPTIQHIVNEAVKSGIKEILLIVSSSKNSIIDHFDTSYELEKRLLEKNKINLYKMVKKISNSVNIHFIRQKEPNGLGDAISLASVFMGNEPFAVLLGDDFVYTKPNKKTALLQCIEAYEKTGKSIVGVQKVSKQNVHKYGIIEPEGKISNSIIKVKSVVEKPKKEDAPSQYAVLGRYVLTKDIFQALQNTKADKSGEIQLTDAIQKLCLQHKVAAYNFSGKRYDIGSKQGYVEATIDMALKDPEISKEVMKYIKKIR